MNPRSFFGVLVDTCGTCGGIYFDEGEVSQIRARGGDRAFEELDAIVQPAPEYFNLEENLHRRCPNCLAGMHRFRYMYTSPVFLDSCESCGGIWIENGELTKMKNYLAAAKTAPKPELTPEEAEIGATIDALSIERHEKANSAHRFARAISYYPWE